MSGNRQYSCYDRAESPREGQAAPITVAAMIAVLACLPATSVAAQAALSGIAIDGDPAPRGVHQLTEQGGSLPTLGVDLLASTEVSTLACTSPGAIQCGSECIDPLFDADNCGGCGQACDPLEACVSGSVFRGKFFLGVEDGVHRAVEACLHLAQRWGHIG